MRAVPLLAVVLALHGPHPLRAQTCLAVGYGGWRPTVPEWLPDPWFRAPPHMRLLATPAAAASSPKLRGWKRVGPAPDLGRDTIFVVHASEGHLPYEFGMSDVFGGWRAPVPDSLELRRLAGLSWELAVAGRWSADTLRGRAHAYSDVRAPAEEPRANAYAIRFACGKRAAAAVADRALHELLRADLPDAPRGRREARAEMDMVCAGGSPHIGA